MLIAGIGSYDPKPDPYFVRRDRSLRLTEKILNSVAFIGVKDGQGRFQPRATAFFVQYIQDQHRFDHLVTAEHVVSGLISKGYDIWLRANVKGGTTTEVHLKDVSAFRFHPNNESDPTDVAVCPFSTIFKDEETDQIIRLDTVSLVLNDDDHGFLPRPDFMETVGLGSEIAIVGLFRSHYGANRNVPIVRVGNISAMLSEPVHTNYAGYIKAYLVEAISIAGLSGSPVMVMPDSSLLLATMLNRGLGNQGGRPPQAAALLGLMHGHFDVPNLNEDVVADANEPERSVHTGIGVVIPVEKIVETIEHPELVEMRKKFVEQLRKQGATADLAPEHVEAPVLPANDENPKHREDFNSLVGAAARKREQED